MLTARVIGHATATVKHPSMEGWKLLVVQPLHWEDRSPDGTPVLLKEVAHVTLGPELRRGLAENVDTLRFQQLQM